MPHKRAKRSVREHLRSQNGTDLPPPKSAIVKKGGKGDIANEAIPKSLARVLNAAKVREGYRERKRKNDEDDGQGGGGKRKKVDGKEGKTKEGVSGILPGESLQHYNKRVEASMRPLVCSAVQTSLAVSRSADRKQREEIQDKKRQRKEKEAHQQPHDKKTGKGSNSVDNDDGDDDNDNDEIPQNSRSKAKPRATEFEAYSTSAPRRLNDIAQAPPQLKSLKARGAAIGPDGLPTSSGMGKKHDGVLSMAQKHMMEMEREKAVKRYRELKAQRETEKERQRGEA